MKKKVMYRIAYGNSGYTHGCGAGNLALADEIAGRMRKLYKYVRIEVIE